MEYTRTNHIGRMKLQHNHYLPTDITQNTTAQTHTQERQRYLTQNKLETDNTLQLRPQTHYKALQKQNTKSHWR